MTIVKKTESETADTVIKMFLFYRMYYSITTSFAEKDKR